MAYTVTFMTHVTMEAGDWRPSKVPMTLDNMEQQLWLVPYGRIVTYWSWMYG